MNGLEQLIAYGAIADGIILTFSLIVATVIRKVDLLPSWPAKLSLITRCGTSIGALTVYLLYPHELAIVELLTILSLVLFAVILRIIFINLFRYL